MLRYLTSKRKRERKEKNHAAITPIYARGAGTVAADLIAVHQASDPKRVDKIKAAAGARRRQRDQRRKRNHNAD